MKATILVALWCALVQAAPQNDYPVKPVPFTAVHVNDVFWAPRIETNRKVTIPAAFQKDEETGRVDLFRSFTRYATVMMNPDAINIAPVDEFDLDKANPRIALTTGKGFLDYETLDIEAYRRDRLKAFVALLAHLGMTRPPVLENTDGRDKPGHHE